MDMQSTSRSRSASADREPSSPTCKRVKVRCQADKHNPLQCGDILDVWSVHGGEWVEAVVSDIVEEGKVLVQYEVRGSKCQKKVHEDSKNLGWDDVQEFGRTTGAPGKRILVPPAQAKEPFIWHQQVLESTLNALSTSGRRELFRAKALENVSRWKENLAEANSKGHGMRVVLRCGDWGEVTRSLTEQYGTIFAVLNMANARFPGGGGGYMEGTLAQEENMFRRTDCHFFVNRKFCDMTWLPDLHAKSSVVKSQVHDFVYKKEMQELINGEHGYTYLDMETPRVCIRGPATKPQEEGYKMFEAHDLFPFYELKAAAEDLRELVPEGGDLEKDASKFFDKGRAQVRIVAHLDTLKAKGVRHAVLSAFGCGAFKQPSGQVAQIYKEVLKNYTDHFDVIAFAIFHCGYGPDNWTPFKEVFEMERDNKDRAYDVDL